MSKKTTPDKLSEALAEELGLYREEVDEQLRQVTRKSMADLVRKTKATAPVGRRGSYKKNIAANYDGLKKSKMGLKAIWYVKAPDHRLTHLLVHGHAKKDGGRTKADPFLKNALDEVLPAFEAAVEEALKND